MSIEKKKPTTEFYTELDKVVNHLDIAGRQIKSSRQAYDNAVKIAKKQGFDDFEISTLVKDYLKDKIPKTSLYRYLKELEPIVPMEQINYNNVLEHRNIDIQESLVNAIKEFNELKRLIPEWADMIAEKIYKNIDLDIEENRYDDKKYLNAITETYHKLGQALLKAANGLEKEYPKEKIIAEIKRSYIKLCADVPEMKHIDTDLSYIDDFLHSHYKDKK